MLAAEQNPKRADNQDVHTLAIRLVQNIDSFAAYVSQEAVDFWIRCPGALAISAGEAAEREYRDIVSKSFADGMENPADLKEIGSFEIQHSGTFGAVMFKQRSSGKFSNIFSQLSMIWEDIVRMSESEAECCMGQIGTNNFPEIGRCIFFLIKERNGGPGVISYKIISDDGSYNRKRFPFLSPTVWEAGNHIVVRIPFSTSL